MESELVNPNAWAKELQFPAEMDLTDHLERKLRAHLLVARGESSHRDGRPIWWDFWIMAFDWIAETLLLEGVLTELMLREQIPAVLRDAGVLSGIMLLPWSQVNRDIESGRRSIRLTDTDVNLHLATAINKWTGRLNLAAESHEGLFIDETHQKHVRLYNAQRDKRRVNGEGKKATMELWLAENKGISRTALTYYLAGRLKNLSLEKRRQVEASIDASSDKNSD